jgi:hypothetical protein
MLEQVKKLYKTLEAKQSELNGTATAEQWQQLLTEMASELDRIIKIEAAKGKIAKLKAKLDSYSKQA